MPLFKKKPVIIEAFLWTGGNHRVMNNFLSVDDDANSKPLAMGNKNYYIDHAKVDGGLIIKTLEGEHIASIGDWIIKGVNGEFYPCKPDIFVKTYELVSQSEADQ